MLKKINYLLPHICLIIIGSKIFFLLSSKCIPDHQCIYPCDIYHCVYLCCVYLCWISISLLIALGIRYVTEQEAVYQQVCGFSSQQSIVHEDCGVCVSLSVAQLIMRAALCSSGLHMEPSVRATDEWYSTLSEMKKKLNDFCQWFIL